MKDKKLLNTIILFVILVLFTATGYFYTEHIQEGDILEARSSLAALRAERIEPELIIKTLKELQESSKNLDEMLKKEKHLIPQNQIQSSFYKYIDNLTSTYSKYSHVDIKFKGKEKDGDFEVLKYELSGIARFRDYYKLISNIESSKEFKKISDVNLGDIMKFSDEDYPMYQVQFSFTVSVYSSPTNQFITTGLDKERFRERSIYNVFFPLIRNEIPPNKDNLLEASTARLLALIPEGAYITDSKGGSYLLKEGDPVYLGYLTEIDFVSKRAMIVINKGGLIERFTLLLEEEGEKNAKN